MNPDTVNLLVVFCLAAIVTATALLLRVWRDVKQLDSHPIDVVTVYRRSHCRYYCLRHNQPLNPKV